MQQQVLAPSGNNTQNTRASELLGLVFCVECVGVQNYISYNRTRLGKQAVDILRSVSTWIKTGSFYLSDMCAGEQLPRGEYVVMYGPAPKREKVSICARLGVDENILELRSPWLLGIVKSPQVEPGTPVMRIRLDGDLSGTRKGGFEVKILGRAE